MGAANNPKRRSRPAGEARVEKILCRRRGAKRVAGQRVARASTKKSSRRAGTGFGCAVPEISAWLDERGWRKHVRRHRITTFAPTDTGPRVVPAANGAGRGRPLRAIARHAKQERGRNANGRAPTESIGYGEKYATPSRARFTANAICDRTMFHAGVRGSREPHRRCSGGRRAGRNRGRLPVTWLVPAGPRPRARPRETAARGSPDRALPGFFSPRPCTNPAADLSYRV